MKNKKLNVGSFKQNPPKQCPLLVLFYHFQPKFQIPLHQFGFRNLNRCKSAKSVARYPYKYITFIKEPYYNATMLNSVSGRCSQILYSGNVPKFSPFVASPPPPSEVRGQKSAAMQMRVQRFQKNMKSQQKIFQNMKPQQKILHFKELCIKSKIKTNRLTNMQKYKESTEKVTKTYVDAVANAVIQAWKSPHQNLNGFLRMKKKQIACKVKLRLT